MSKNNNPDEGKSIDKNSKKIYSLELTESSQSGLRSDSGAQSKSNYTHIEYFSDVVDKLHQKHEKIKSFFEKNQEKMRFSLKNGENAARFAVAENKPYYQIPFDESVDKVINNANIGDGLIFVRDTPEALRSIGIPALPVMITQRHIKDIYNNYAPNGKNAHDLKEQIKALPQMLEKPIAIIYSEKYNDRVIVITQYKDKNGNDIMVPVIIGADTSAEGGIRITANIAASAYGKKNVQDMLDKAIEMENNGDIAIFGANKKIASKLSLRGLQLSQWSGFNAIHNIHDENSPVKLKIEKNTKTLQFKRWFGDSKVVDENGEPLVVYHGTNADFNIFDTEKFGAWFSKSMEYAESMMEERGGELSFFHFLIIRRTKCYG